ncbi:hypothetical protein U9M48_008293, partial [Paspalum notatum var. saurae]
MIKIEEDKAQLSLSLISSRYTSSLSLLELSLSDSEATLELDQSRELAIPDLKITGYSFFFTSNPSQQIVGIWKWFGQLRTLEIRECQSFIYWPDEEFLSLISLTSLIIKSCSKLTGRAQMSGGATRAKDQLLPQLKELWILNRIVLFNSYWEKMIQSRSLYRWSMAMTSHTRVPEHLQGNNSLPCLEKLYMYGSLQLAALSNLPPSLRDLDINECPELRSISGHLDGLVKMTIERCNKLETPDWGNMPALTHLYIPLQTSNILTWLSRELLCSYLGYGPKEVGCGATVTRHYSDLRVGWLDKALNLLGNQNLGYMQFQGAKVRCKGVPEFLELMQYIKRSKKKASTLDLVPNDMSVPAISLRECRFGILEDGCKV